MAKTMSTSPTFGDVLRRYRLAAGLTQEALAEQAGLSARAITDLERGVNRSPRKDTLARLAAALELSPEERGGWEAAQRRGQAPGGPAIGNANVPLLVGRREELRLLERHLAPGGPPLLLLAGEPGIGKSRLLRELAPRAAQRGMHVLIAGCRQRGGQEPYAPILHALERHLRSIAPAQARAALRGCAWLVRLLPELAGGPVEALPAVALPAEQERRLMFDAVVRFLGNVAGPGGMLLVLDDLQWADADAVEFLRALAHAAAGTQLRIAGAYRDTEVGPDSPLAIMLRDLAQAGLAAHRHVAALPPDEARQLLQRVLDPGTGAGLPPGSNGEIAERLPRRANGVPFFLVSCAQGVRAGALEAGAEEVPWTVAQSIRQRVALLPAAARELLGTAAVVGRDIARATLATVTSRADEAVLADLEPACRARLLEEAGAAAYRFAHDVIREVVEADLGAGRRALLHRRVAEVLEAQADPPLEAVAYHYGEGEAWEKALPYLIQAGDKATAAYAH